MSKIQTSSSELVVTLPKLHVAQQYILANSGRFNLVCCGRRFGKSFMLAYLACDMVLKGGYVGIFVPAYKFGTEIYRDVLDILQPLKPDSSKTEGIIRLKQTGGRVDFWSLDNPFAGRGRKYHIVLIDEAAFAPETTGLDTYDKAISPTLLDFLGVCYLFSTPSGVNPDNLFYAKSEDPLFKVFFAPTCSNPYMSLEELDLIEKRTHPLIFRQEYLAEFVDWSGEQFFSIDKLLENGQPIDDSIKIDSSIFAIVDTAMKTGTENDATAVIYFGKKPHYLYPDGRPRLYILDWDIVQVEGAFLTTFITDVHTRLNQLAERHQSLFGAKGIWIEDKSSGTILLQHFSRRPDIPCFSIDSKLTQVGKDERALAASPYIQEDLVKFTRSAYEKTTNLKGTTRNHLLSQLSLFRIGDKDAAKRADDLTDCFTYGTILGVGQTTGY